MLKLIKEKMAQVIYKLLKKNVNGVYGADVPYPQSVIINTESVILENGRPTRIRYAEGESSIYVKEQSEYAKPSRGIAIVEGFLSVDSGNKTLIEYLNKTELNSAPIERVSNVTPLFSLLDSETNESKLFNDEMNSISATTTYHSLYKSDTNLLRAVSRYLGFNMKASYNVALLNYVKLNPTEFLAIMENPEKVRYVKVLELIYTAEESGLIQYGAGRWFWTNINGGDNALLSMVGQSEEYHKALADKLVSSENGQDSVERLKGLLYPKEAKVNTTSIKKAVVESHDEIEGLGSKEFVKALKDYNVIQWFVAETKPGEKRKMGDFIITGGDNEPIGRSAKSVSDYLDKNEDIKIQLTARLSQLMADLKIE